METIGKQMHDGNAETRSEAARLLGHASTPAKVASCRAQAAARVGIPLSEEHRAKLREAQRARRAREAEQK